METASKHMGFGLRGQGEAGSRPRKVLGAVYSCWGRPGARLSRTWVEKKRP